MDTMVGTPKNRCFVSLVSFVSSPLTVIGLVIMITSELATLARIEPFYSWNTPICWTGFILFADSVVYRARGRSWMRTTPREFILLTLLSIPLWLVFEGYNLIIRNWYYTGLPDNFWLRMFGYAWSFATIWPAIFEAGDLVSVWRARGSTGSPPASNALALSASNGRPELVEGRAGRRSILLGAVMLLLPFVLPRAVARYLAAPVWLGFIFLLDPINKRFGGAFIADDLNRMHNFLLSGLLCGVLWEFWNFWAGAKWHYTVPIMQNVKIFEMPLPGYLGFPAFALECFTMYVSVRLMFQRLAS
jgi:hypothetical protein